MFRRLPLVPSVIAGALVAGGLLASSVSYAGASKPESTRFSLFPNQKFLACVSGDSARPARVSARVERGDDNDTMTLRLDGFKPDLAFDLFTVENTPQLADGTANPDFKDNFGLAWYQSDIHVNGAGRGRVRVKTILLDQIFGFDKGVALPPTNTFNVGFWFNDPADAQACGFTGSTPFNGEHKAGPLAFVTRLDATTHLGPLCTDPTTSPLGAVACNP